MTNNKITALSTTVDKLNISNTTDMTRATEVLSQANQALDAIKAQEALVVNPLKQALKAKQAEFAPLKLKLTSLVVAIRTKMSEYQTAEMRRVAEEKAKIASRIKEGKGNLSVETGVARIEAIEKPEEAIKTEAGKVSFVTQTKLQITDVSLIPREYLVPDEKLIKEELKAGKTVKGAELIEVQVVRNIR